MLGGSAAASRRLPSRLVVVAGTYDGVLAGWDTVSHESDSGGGDTRSTASKEDDIQSSGGVLHDDAHHAEDPNAYLKLSFAMAAHEGSVRCLSISSAPASSAVQHGGSKAAVNGEHGDNDDDNQSPISRKKRRKRKKHHGDDIDNGDGDEAKTNDSKQIPGTLLSGGYDESINVFNLIRHVQAGELRSAADLGTPTCSSFAPPPSSPSPATHALVGMSSGKIVLYKKRDWSVQHVLSGHDGEHGGVNCLSVHPSGRMALSGGRGDGKIILWDLMRGRLAFVHKIPPPAGSRGRRKTTVTDLAWSDDGLRYAFATDGGKVTARDVDTGEDLLDVMLPSRANQIAFIGGAEGLFLAAACDDGSLPVLAVGSLSDEKEEVGARRAVMAIEPVDGPVAGDARFKCLNNIEGGSGFLVVTANSGGVISIIDLEGAARMILSDEEDDRERGSADEDDISRSSNEDEGEEDDVAAEFLESVRVGSGARITNMAVWSAGGDGVGEHEDSDEDSFEQDGNGMGESIDGIERDVEIGSDKDDESDEKQMPMDPKENMKVMSGSGKKSQEIEMDAKAIKRARALVKQAKKRQRKEKKRKSRKE